MFQALERLVLSVGTLQLKLLDLHTILQNTSRFFEVAEVNWLVESGLWLIKSASEHSGDWCYPTAPHEKLTAP